MSNNGERLDDLPIEELAKFIMACDKANTERPREEDVRALQKYLETYPQLWQVAGNAARHAAMDLIAHGIAATPAVKEGLRAAWDGLKGELGFQEATTVERLLIEQVVLCWLRLNLVEQHYTHRTMRSLSASQGSLSFWDRRLSAAQRRFLRACETLARVRKLARNTPALQVNIATQGGQQVNVAGEMDVKRGAGNQP